MNKSFVFVGRAHPNERRMINQLSLRRTFHFVKDTTQAAGQGEPWTPMLADTSIGGVA